MNLWTAAMMMLLSGTPELLELEPKKAAPYAPIELRLLGTGFDAGTIVFIETGVRGRFLAHPAVCEESACTVSLPLGFGPRPTRRRIYVENPGGARSAALELVLSAAETELEDGEEEERDDHRLPVDSAAPSLHEIRPEVVPAATQFVLEIHGEGFAVGARVEITANLNAGSTRLPDYGARVFPAIRLDEGLLEVELDRGFYPIPGTREVVVVNPDGSRSQPGRLRIKPREEEK